MRRLILEFTRSSVRALTVDHWGASLCPRRLTVEAVTGDDLEGSLRRLLQRLRIRRGPVVCVIPRDQVITRILQVPARHPEELHRMVQLAGPTQFPYPAEDIVTASAVIESREDGSTVQLVAGRRDLIERYLRMMQQAGLEPLGMTPNVWGLLGWYQQWATMPAASDPVMLVHLDGDHTDMVFIRQQRIAFSRSVTQEGAASGGVEETIDILIQELERSLSTLRRDVPGAEPSVFLLTGVGNLETIARVLGQRFSTPVRTMGVSGSRRLPAAVATAEVSAAALLGAAAADPASLVNLIPTEARQAQSSRRRMRELSLTGGLALASVVLGLALLGRAIHRREHAARGTVARLHQLDTSTRQLERQATLVQLVENAQTSRYWTAAMLSGLFHVTPADITYQSLTFERPRGELVVRGSAPTTRQVLDYVRQLEQSPQWRRVELRYSRRRTGARGGHVDFEIALRRGASI